MDQILMNGYRDQKLVIIPESGVVFPLEINKLSDWKGIILATSGTEGDRKWIYHSWETITKVAARNNDSRPAVCFLSLTHAAGIEAFFQALLSKRKIQFISLPWSEEDLEIDFSPKVLSLTPVTLWKLLSSSSGKKLLSEVEEIKVGGEALSKELVSIVHERFPKLVISSVYGTTEAWSIKTKHLGEGEITFTDELVDIDLRGEELWIKSPFLFNAIITQDGEIDRSSPTWWNTSDRLYSGKLGGYFFRPRMGRVGKNAGRKFLSKELEEQLKIKFKIPWAQVLWKEDMILGQIPHLILPQNIDPSNLKDWAQGIGLSTPTVEVKNSPVETNRGKSL